MVGCIYQISYIIAQSVFRLLIYYKKKEPKGKKAIRFTHLLDGCERRVLNTKL